MVFKDIGHHKVQLSLRYRKNSGWALDYSSLELREDFQTMAWEQVSQVEHSKLPKFGSQSEEFRETKTSRLHRTTHQRGERCTERELWKSASSPWGFSSVLISSFMWGNHRRLGKIHWKGLERKGVELTHNLFSPALMGKCITHGVPGRQLGKVLPQ